MYSILESKQIQKTLDRLPVEVLERYEFWKAIAAESGVAGLLRFSKFKDHGLSGQWKGARSSSLGYKWRVIYTANERAIEITVLEVNAHDYRKKS